VILSSLISVVIPFYEGKVWLLEAIKSVVNQTYDNIEVFVVNDGSKEDVSDIIYFKHENITLINKENGGAASARNVGIEHSRGKYIAFLDSDDIWSHDKIDKQFLYMEENQLVWSQHSYYKFWQGESKREIVDTSMCFGDVYLDLFVSCKVQTSTVMVLRDVLISKNIRFPLDFRRGQDGEFYKDLAKHYKLGFVPDLFGGFRMRGANVGFSPKVLLLNKYQVWDKIKNDNFVLGKLPSLVKLGFRVNYLMCSFAIKMATKHTLSKKQEYYFFGLSYIVPYVIFKVCSLLYLRKNKHD
ncbi:TPA: glycosyltransferase, partial [Vibrio parahaemolyticus]|nr:glycosyltransferase [Vibrio parahaemolyticus]